MPPSLPVEIVDAIIDEIEHHDERTLLNCCLVCCQWLSASRRRLFSIVLLRSDPNRVHDDRQQYTLFLSRVLHNESMKRWLNCTVELYIAFSPQSSIVVPKDPVIRVHPACFPLDFAGRLPNLSFLSLSGVDCSSDFPHPRASLAFSQFPSLRTLHVGRYRFSSFNDLRRMLCAIPALRHLRLSQVSWVSQGIFLTPETVHAAGRPMLETLELSNFKDKTGAGQEPWFIRVTRWLSCSTLTRSSLKKLSLQRCVSSRSPEDVLMPFLPLFAALESLRLLDAPLPHSQDDLAALSLCRYISELYVHCASLQPWTDIDRMLRMLDADVRRVEMHVMTRCPLPVDNLDGFPPDVELLEASFEHEAFKNLQEVVLDLRLGVEGQGAVWMTNEQVGSALRRKLSRLDKRGVLKLREVRVVSVQR